MRSLRCVAVVAVVLVGLVVQTVRAQALNQVPADTLAVLKVNNLKQVSDKVAKLLNTLGVAQMTGIIDPLATFKSEVGINAGLDEAGAALFVYLDPEAAGVDSDESMLILLPVSDYAAFLGNFEGAQTEGAVTTVQLKGSPTFISQWGTYAALSPSQALVQAAPQQAMTVANALSKDLAESDAILYANIEKIRARALPELAKAKADIGAEIERELGRNEAQREFVPVAQAAATQALTFVEDLLQDGNAGAISVNLSDGGIAFSAIGDFKPDSRFGKAVASMKGTDQPLVRGLPAGEYLVYGGYAINSPEVVGLAIDYVAPILNAFAATQEGKAAEGEKLLAATRKYYTASKGASFGMLAPAGQLGQEALVQMVMTNFGDGAAMQQAAREMAEAQSALFAEMMGGAAMTYKAQVKTVEGVQLDEVTVDMNLTPPAAVEGETPEQARARQRAAREAAQAQQAMAVLYGPNGMSQFNGVAGDAFIIGSGISDEVLANLIKAAKADTDLLADKPHVQPVTAALPQQRIAAVFIPLDQWAKTGSAYAAMFGFPMQLQLPPDLPPVGVAVTTQGGTVRIESYVPVDLIQSLVAAGLQAAGGAGAGGAMGDPGGM